MRGTIYSSKFNRIKILCLLIVAICFISCVAYRSDDLEIIIDAEGTHITTPEHKYNTPKKLPEVDSKALDDAIESIK